MSMGDHEEDDLAAKLFDAVCVDAVSVGHCLITHETDLEIKILYVGPVNRAPDVRGAKVYLNSVDFNRLNNIIKKKQH